MPRDCRLAGGVCRLTLASPPSLASPLAGRWPAAPYFVIDERGRVVLRPATNDVRDLEGLLHRVGEEPVGVEEMERVIRERGGRAAGCDRTATLDGTLEGEEGFELLAGG